MPLLTGEVIDPNELGIDQAEITLLDDEDRIVDRATSDATGGFRFAELPESARRLVASRAGYHRAVQRLDSPPKRTRPVHLVVTLEPEGEITGWIRLADGSPPSFPIEVLACEASGPPPTARQVELARNSHPLSHRTLMGGSGQFRIGGLRRGVEYLVYAGGGGYVRYPADDGGVTRAVAGGEPVEIVVAPVYVVDIRLTGPAGEALDSSPLLTTWPPTSLDEGELRKERRLRAVSTRNPELLLSGVAAGGYLGFDHSTHRFTAMYTSQEDAERIGPMKLRVHLPGYETLDTEIWARRLSGDESPVQEIALARRARGFGNLVVRLDGYEMETDAPARRGARWARPPVGEISLRALDGGQLDGSRSRYLFYCWEEDLPRFRVDGVPAGIYRAKLSLPHGTLAARPEAIEIRDGERAEIVFAAASLGGVEIDVSVHQGSEIVSHTGSVRIELLKRLAGPEIAAESFTYAQAPYRLVGLVPGEYGVRAASDVHDLRSDTSWFVVEPGLVTRVSLQTVRIAHGERGEAGD